MPDVIHNPAADCACEPGGPETCEYRMLADEVIKELNPRDGDEAEVALLMAAVGRTATYVRSLPCTCDPGTDDDPCGRGAALGQWHGVPVGR